MAELTPLVCVYNWTLACFRERSSIGQQTQIWHWIKLVKQINRTVLFFYKHENITLCILHVISYKASDTRKHLGVLYNNIFNYLYLNLIPLTPVVLGLRQSC